MNYKKNYNYSIVICIACLTLIFFSFPLIITFDSAQYHSYIDIFNGTKSWHEWNVLRGIVFPLFIYICRSLFGANQNALLGVMYIFYIVSIGLILKVIMDVLGINSLKHKTILAFFVFVFIALDPLAFGYYHACLTEFFASTVMVLSCYFAYELAVNHDTISIKHKYLIFFYYIIITPVAWHLKQPYVSVAVFPYIALLILLLIKRLKFKELLKYIIVFALMILSLIISICIWSQVTKNPDTLPTTKTSDYLLKSQIIFGLSNFVINDVDVSKDLNSKLLSSKDKQIITQNKDNSLFLKNSKIVNVLNYNGLVKASYLLQMEESKQFEIEIDSTTKMYVFSNKTFIEFLFKDFLTSPDAIIGGYIDNYLGIANVYSFSSKTSTLTKLSSRQISFIRAFQNSGIAYKICYISPNYSNISSIPYQWEPLVNVYKQESGSGSIFSNLFFATSYKSNFIFSFMIFILPFLLIIYFVKLILKRYSKIDIFIFISCFAGFFHILLHAVFGAELDRYAFPTYLLLLTVLVLLTIQFFVFIKNTVYKEISRKINSKLIVKDEQKSN